MDQCLVIKQIKVDFVLKKYYSLHVDYLIMIIIAFNCILNILGKLHSFRHCCLTCGKVLPTIYNWV